MSLQISDLLDLSKTEHAALFEGCEYPWQALSRIGKYLEVKLSTGTACPAPTKINGSAKISPHAVIEGKVFIGKGTVVEPHSYIKGPAWIGENCEIRQGAYVRGNVIAGNNCVLGNSCEFKNSVLFNEVQVPHFAYVGDSILGFHTHLASGVTLSNLKITKGNVVIVHDGKKIDSGLRKFGAILGDYSEAGCHCVLNPGSILGRYSRLYPQASWRGVCPPNTIVKLKQEHLLVEQRK